MTGMGGLEATRRLKRLLVDLPPAQAFVSSELGRRLRKRLYQIRASEVERIGTALERAGVVWFLAGGWGVDALVGHQTRHHGDLDLCIEVADDGEARAVEVLGTLGYRPTVHRAPSGHRFPFRSVLRDRSGRTVDLILITCLDTSPTDEDVPVLGVGDRSSGSIIVDERPFEVPCLSPELQVAVHRGYIPQERDRHDVAVLCETFDLTIPSIYRRETPRRSIGAWMHACVWEVITRFRGISALVVLVPEANEILSAVGGTKRGAMPAHITITYPFVPPRRIGQRDHEQLEEIVAGTNPCTVDVAELDHHELVTFLPFPAEGPLRRLIEHVIERWPEHPRYGDGDLDVPPHLTLGFDVLPEEIVDTVLPFLPLQVEIDRLTLMTRGLTGRWRIASEFPLRGASAPEPVDGA